MESDHELDLAPNPGMTPPRRWLLGAVGWDGGLPLAVALSPEALHGLGVDPWLISVFLIPIVASLIRAHHGQRQLERFGHSLNNWWRQLLFGLALCVLLTVEAGLAIVQDPKGPGPQAWLIIGVLYLIYLALILASLRPLPVEAQER